MLIILTGERYRWAKKAIADNNERTSLTKMVVAESLFEAPLAPAFLLTHSRLCELAKSLIILIALSSYTRISFAQRTKANRS